MDDEHIQRLIDSYYANRDEITRIAGFGPAYEEARIMLDRIERLRLQRIEIEALIAESWKMDELATMLGRLGN